MLHRPLADLTLQYYLLNRLSRTTSKQDTYFDYLSISLNQISLHQFLTNLIIDTKGMMPSSDNY